MNRSFPGTEYGGVMEPTGSLWPNGEFSVGYAPAGGLERRLDASELAAKSLAHLDLSIESNSHSEVDYGKAPRGTRGLTAYGKRLLRNSVWRLQRVYGKRCLAFVTLTLPGVTFEESWNLSTDWARVVRVFFQKLGRYMSRLGLPSTYVSCTEMQPERSERDGHPALHLHFVCVTRLRSERRYRITPGEFRWLWASVIGPMCSEVSFWGGVENVSRIRKDASSYMSKYMSKGVSMGSPPRSDGTGWSLPTSWYSVSLPLRRWVKNNTRRDKTMMLYLESVARSTQKESCCHYCFSGVIEEMSGTGPHYHVGRLRGEFMRELVEIWRCAKLVAP